MDPAPWPTNPPLTLGRLGGEGLARLGCGQRGPQRADVLGSGTGLEELELQSHRPGLRRLSVPRERLQGVVEAGELVAGLDHVAGGHAHRSDPAGHLEREDTILVLDHPLPRTGPSTS